MVGVQKAILKKIYDATGKGKGNEEPALIQSGGADDGDDADGDDDDAGHDG